MSRSYEVSIDINATPERVFEVVTVPELIQKWFGPSVRVDPRAGGEYVVSWGPGMELSTTISAYDPPKHFGTARERSVAYNEKGKPVETGVMQKIAIDDYIEPVSDGVTRLRLVQSGFGPEPAWDAEIESTKAGWTKFLEKLKQVAELR